MTRFQRLVFWLGVASLGSAGWPGALAAAAKDVIPLDQDAAIERTILAKAAELPLPDLTKEIQAEIKKQWALQIGTFRKRWQDRFTALAYGPRKRVNHDNAEEVAASVMFLRNGTWQFSQGKGDEALPKTHDGITECYQKVYSQYTTDNRGNQWMSADPRAYSSWKPLKWDAELGMWVAITGADRRRAQAAHQQWLEAELAKAAAAALPPTASNLQSAKDYAARKNLKNAVERLVLAYRAEFRLRALEWHQQEFLRNPIPPLGDPAK